MDYPEDLVDPELIPYAIAVGTLCNSWANLESAIRCLFMVVSEMPLDNSSFGIAHCFDMRDQITAIKLAYVAKRDSLNCRKLLPMCWITSMIFCGPDAIDMSTTCGSIGMILKPLHASNTGLVPFGLKPVNRLIGCPAISMRMNCWRSGMSSGMLQIIAKHLFTFRIVSIDVKALSKSC